MEKILEFPKIVDPRGNLTYLQSYDQIPFEIKRVFWTYDVPGGERRGGHAYRTQQEVILALSGSFDVIITDKYGNTSSYHLNRSYFGLFVPNLVWRHMENFSTNAVSLHLSSGLFAQEEYIRDMHYYQSIAP